MGEEKGVRWEKTFSVSSFALLSISTWITTQFQSSNCFLSPLGDWSYNLRSHTCRSTWGALTNTALAERDWGLKNTCWRLQHCSSPWSHRPSVVTGGCVQTAGQHSAQAGCLCALPSRQKGHSPAAAGTSSPLSHSFQAEPAAVPIEEKWNKGNNGGLEQTRLLRGELQAQEQESHHSSKQLGVSTCPQITLICYRTGSCIRGPQL